MSEIKFKRLRPNIRTLKAASSFNKYLHNEAIKHLTFIEPVLVKDGDRFRYNLFKEYIKGLEDSNDILPLKKAFNAYMKYKEKTGAEINIEKLTDNEKLWDDPKTVDFLSDQFTVYFPKEIFENFDELTDFIAENIDYIKKSAESAEKNIKRLMHILNRYEEALTGRKKKM